MARPLTVDDSNRRLSAACFYPLAAAARRQIARGRALGRMALNYGGVNFAALDELDPTDSDHNRNGGRRAGFRQMAGDAARQRQRGALARRAVSRAAGRRDLRARAGLQCLAGRRRARADLCRRAANGRGHPTVKMGGMGLASRPDLSIIQVATGGQNGSDAFVVSVEGDIVRTSNMLRQAAVINGGLIYAARGPLTAGICYDERRRRRHHVPARFGPRHARREGRRSGAGDRRVPGRQLLVEGEVVLNDVAYGGGFDLGRMIVRGAAGEATLGVYNEFMTADMNGQRVASFPDLIGTLDPETGDVISISSRAWRARRGHHRASLEIPGRQGRARSRRVSRSRTGDGG